MTDFRVRLERIVFPAPECRRHCFNTEEQLRRAYEFVRPHSDRLTEESATHVSAARRGE